MFAEEFGTVLAFLFCTVGNKSIPFQALHKGFFFVLTAKTCNMKMLVWSRRGRKPTNYPREEAGPLRKFFALLQQAINFFAILRRRDRLGGSPPGVTVRDAQFGCDTEKTA